MIYCIGKKRTANPRLCDDKGNVLTYSDQIMDAFRMMSNEISHVYFRVDGCGCAIHRSYIETPFFVVFGYDKFFVSVHCDSKEVSKFTGKGNATDVLTIKIKAPKLFPLRELAMRSKDFPGTTALITNRIMKVIKQVKNFRGMDNFMIKTDNNMFILHDEGKTLVQLCEYGQVFSWLPGDKIKKIDEDQFAEMCNEEEEEVSIPTSIKSDYDDDVPDLKCDD